MNNASFWPIYLWSIEFHNFGKIRSIQFFWLFSFDFIDKFVYILLPILMIYEKYKFKIFIKKMYIYRQSIHPVLELSKIYRYSISFFIFFWLKTFFFQFYYKNFKHKVPFFLNINNRKMSMYVWIGTLFLQKKCCTERSSYKKKINTYQCKIKNR